MITAYAVRDGNARRWIRTLAIYAPGIALLIAGVVTIILFPVVYPSSTCSCPDGKACLCPVVMGTFNPLGPTLLFIGGVYSLIAFLIRDAITRNAPFIPGAASTHGSRPTDPSLVFAASNTTRAMPSAKGVATFGTRASTHVLDLLRGRRAIPLQPPSGRSKGEPIRRARAPSSSGTENFRGSRRQPCSTLLGTLLLDCGAGATSRLNAHVP